MSSGSSEFRRGIVAFVLVAAGASMTVHAKGVVVSPSVLYLAPSRSVIESNSLRATLMLEPTSPEPTTVRASVATFVLDDGGRPARAANGKFDARIRIDRREVTLRNHREPLELTFDLPRDAAESFWSAVVLEVESVQQAETDVIVRVVVPVIVTVAGTERPLIEMRDAEAVVQKNELLLSVTLANCGRTAVRSKLFVAIEVPGTNPPLELSDGESGEVLLLPGGTRRLELTLPLTNVVNAEAHFYFQYGSKVATAIAPVPPR